VAPTSSRLSSIAHCLPLLHNLAHRRYVGADQPAMREHLRVRLKKNPQPSADIVDSQSVKTTGAGGEERGYDGGKKIKGRKHHLLVDTEGFVLEAKVHSAKLVDWDGIKTLLRAAAAAGGYAVSPPRTSMVDAGYRGEDRGKDWVEKKLG
jgi:putative transposase